MGDNNSNNSFNEIFSLRPQKKPNQMKKFHSLKIITTQSKTSRPPKPASPNTEDGFDIRKEWHRDMERACNGWWEDHIKQIEYTPPWSKPTSNTNEIFSFQ
jgi:hypothetical protein